MDRGNFDLLKNSIIFEQAISFMYFGSYGEAAERKVYPLKLIFKLKAWYLQAFCLEKGKYRTFKISRMGDIKITDEIFEGEKFQAPKIEPFQYDNSRNLIDVKLLFLPHVAYRAYDEFSEQDISKSEDGSLIVSMSMPDDYWLYNYIFSFGAAVEVLEPQSVRDEIVRQIDEIKNKYLDKT